MPLTQLELHLSVLLQQVHFVQVGFYCSYSSSLQNLTFKCKKVYHPWIKLVRLCTTFMLLPFQNIIHQCHTILAVLETSISETHSHLLYPFSSFALCNYNQIHKTQKIESLPCILIRMVGPLERNGWQDVEITADLFWKQNQEKTKKKLLKQICILEF